MAFGDPRGSYHHGNLREALVEAALRMIAERGPTGFAFAEIARAAGVSPAAPYRHFRDRTALVVEVARRGFERFADELARATAAIGHPVTAMEACGRTHLSFARREAASYAAMFQAVLPDDPALRQASDRAFAVVRRAADAACAVATGRRPPALMVALHVWSLSHGIATLYVIDRRPLPMTPEDLLEAGLLVYLRTLGLEAPIT